MNWLLRKNLRTRLTVFYSALLAGALVLYAVCVSSFFLHNLREQLDASLDRDVETVEGDLLMTSDGRVDLTSHEGEADEDEMEGGYLLEVLGSDGSVLYRSSQLNGQALGPVPTQVEQHERGHLASLRLGSGTLVRTIARHHHLPGGRLVIVRLGVSEGPYRQKFWRWWAFSELHFPSS